jgi:hypothetical protein
MRWERMRTMQRSERSAASRSPLPVVEAMARTRIPVKFQGQVLVEDLRHASQDRPEHPDVDH